MKLTASCFGYLNIKYNPFRLIINLMLIKYTFLAFPSFLIIEDCLEIRENLAEILELFDYLVTTVANGRAGIRACLEAPLDLILCDVRMAELDGYGVLSLLTEDKRTAGIPLIFITSRAEPADISRGLKLGAAAYLSKPFYQDELLRVIRTHLKQPT